MRSARSVWAWGILIRLFCATAWAQGSSQQGSESATKSATQNNSAGQNAKPDASAQAEQPTSLGEVARLARTKKGNQPKSGKIFDDDNFPRTHISTKEKVTDTPASSSSELSLSELQGKVVLLDFWVSWCGPCKQALPKLKQLQSIYGSDDFAVISISEDDDERTWREYVADHQMTWVQRFDATDEFKHRFGVNALLTYVLIGRDGKNLERYVGEAAGQSIVERIGPDLKRALQAKL
jgi:thiol-disulfide isomerase/thioredoxin